MDHRDATPGTSPCPDEVSAPRSQTRHPPRGHRWIEAQRDVTHAASCRRSPDLIGLRRSEGLGVPVGEGSASASPYPFGDCRSSTRWGPAFICALSEHPRPAERARMRRRGADAGSAATLARRPPAAGSEAPRAASVSEPQRPAR